MKRARDTHLYPRDLDNPADYVPQPGEIAIQPGDEETLSTGPHASELKKGWRLKITPE
jgi:hypothetical protein